MSPIQTQQKKKLDLGSTKSAHMINFEKRNETPFLLRQKQSWVGDKVVPKNKTKSKFQKRDVNPDDIDKSIQEQYENF